MITGRSMGWPYGFNSHFYVFPRSERINGAVMLGGSTAPGGPVDAVFDGINEKGLAANLLDLAENDFGLASADGRRPRLSFAAWTLYLLSEYGR
ncbi:MAG: hypothetical protein NTZ40_14890 [Cyanobacteria bacterium]|nr:hypothetical protein [Cyanobacteriota bacterium]